MDATIVVVDDKPEEPRGQLLDIQDYIQVVHPHALEEHHLEEADVILVDHHLEEVQWPERALYPLSCRPVNGVALAAIIRAHLKSERFHGCSPSAVALFSARLSEVTPGLDNPAEYIAAQACGLDWAFAKVSRDGRAPGQRILSLANAVSALPEEWPVNDPEAIRDQVCSLLGLNDVEWFGTALAHVERAHPPIHELAEWTDGVAFVRWLAQKVLPYPTFLLDEFQVAIRLGVRPKWFRQHIQSNGLLLQALESSRYKGVLEDFIGKRWWIAGIDHLLWRATDARPLDLRQVRKWLSEQGGGEPEKLSDEETLILNENLEFGGETAPFSSCVRVWPDGWPSYADAPWTEISRARQHDRLRAIVLGVDMERLLDATH